MVVLDSPQDPVAETNLVVDVATPNNNNITHRNLTLQDSTDGDSFLDSLFVRNPFRKKIRTMVVVEVPEGWKVKTDGVPIGRPFVLKPHSEKLLRYAVQPAKPGAEGEVSFVQYDLSKKEPNLMGGFTIAFGPRKAQEEKKKLDLRLEQLEKLIPRLESKTKRFESILPRLEKLLDSMEK